jgi:tRNA(Arg) A34 adenosine deaminase TadA
MGGDPLAIDLPAFAVEVERAALVATDARERMRLVVDLSARNVETSSGGPFAAAVFTASGDLVAVGVNAVVRLNNPVLHAETMALMRAATRLGRYSLSPTSSVTALSSGRFEATAGGFELYSSCEPCAMCLGAILWSGVRRVVFAARRDDAERLGFDEGPVFPQTFDYLRRRGVRVEGGPLRLEAVQVLERYLALDGPIYNG